MPCEKSFIRPYTSICNRAHIIDSSVEYGVIFENILVNEEERLEESLIGRNV